MAESDHTSTQGARAGPRVRHTTSRRALQDRAYVEARVVEMERRAALGLPLFEDGPPVSEEERSQ